MNKRVTLMMGVVLALTTLAGALLGCAGGQAAAAFEPAAASPATTTDLNAGLLSSVLSPEVSGRAAYDLDDDGAVALEVAVRAATAAAGQTFDVFIDSARAGRVTLDDNGQGTLRADSEDGQTVPAVTAGSTIEVRQGDQVVASGQFLTTGNDEANDNGDDNANDNGGDDSANDNGSDDNGGDDNANDNGSDDNANDNDDSANDNGGDDNANDNGSDANDNSGDDNANDNGGDDNANGGDDNGGGDDDNGNDDNGHDDNSGDDNGNDNDNSDPGNGDDNANDNGNN